MERAECAGFSGGRWGDGFRAGRVCGLDFSYGSDRQADGRKGGEYGVYVAPRAYVCGVGWADREETWYVRFDRDAGFGWDGIPNAPQAGVEWGRVREVEIGSTGRHARWGRYPACCRPSGTGPRPVWKQWRAGVSIAGEG
jgi:hypothetical protein